MSLKINDLTRRLATHPTKQAKRQNRIKRIVVHTTNWIISEEELALYDIGPNHISKTGCPTSTYHYTVRQDGTVNHCVPTGLVTWHAGPWNPKSLAVALVYKTDKQYEKAKVKGLVTGPPKNKENAPSKEALTSLLKLLTQLCIEHKVEPTQIFGHRELKGTGWTLKKGSKRLRKTCPGMALNLDWLRKAVTKALQKMMYDRGIYAAKPNLNGQLPAHNGIDGVWGKRSKAAFKLLVDQ